MQRFAVMLLNASLCLPWLWLLGVHVADLSRILTVLCLVCLLAQRGRGLACEGSESRLWKALSPYASFFPLACAIFLAARAVLGSISLDFSIFVQVIDSLARTGTASTSLLGADWQNFFGHHLDLQLWLPAAAVRLGMPPLNAALGLHFLAISLTIYFLGLSISKHPLRVFLLALFAMLPIFRHSFFWSIHDDIFALPFMAASWYFWRKGNYRTLALNLILLCLCKETMGLWVAGFSFAAYIWDKRISHLIFFLLGIFVFCFYVFAQPLLLGKSFDHISKISTLSQFFDGQILLEKLSFLLGLIIPFVLLVSSLRIQLKDLVLLLPALPFIGMIMVSNFSEMWKPLNYYGVIPSLTLLLFCIDMIKRKDLRISFGRLALIISLCFTSGTLKFGKTIVEAVRVGKIEVPDISFLDKGSRLAISPGAHVYLLQSGTSPLPGGVFPGREFVFRTHNINADAAIFLEHERGDFSPDFLANMKPCAGIAGERLVYLCR